jgi:regulator of sigma E protease
MSHFATLPLTFLSFVFLISVIVFIHEFGHYLFAKLAGVKIEVFSIGFGKELFGWNDRSGTRWRVSLLPFGGYVKMYGDTSEASLPPETLDALPEEERKRTFYGKKLWQKALIVVAGPLFNFLLTIGILTFFIMTHGLSSGEPLVGEVMKDSPASSAGLMAGDRIDRIDGERVSRFQDISRIVMVNLGTPVQIALTRGSQQLNVMLTPRRIDEKDDFGNPYSHYIIGIKSKQIVYDKNLGIFRSIGEATRATYFLCDTTLQAMGQMLTQQRSLKEIRGPLGIAKLSGQAAERGFYHVLWLMALISANLGLVNLFPVPLLDGGHLLYYGIEALRGKPINRRSQEYGFRFGMALVSMLMVYAIFNDLQNLLTTAAKH